MHSRWSIVRYFWSDERSLLVLFPRIWSQVWNVRLKGRISQRPQLRSVQCWQIMQTMFKRIHFQLQGSMFFDQLTLQVSRQSFWRLHFMLRRLHYPSLNMCPWSKRRSQLLRINERWHLPEMRFKDFHELQRSMLKGQWRLPYIQWLWWTMSQLLLWFRIKSRKMR